MKNAINQSEIARWIEKGLDLSDPSRDRSFEIIECSASYLCYDRGMFRACILGLAAIGKYGDPHVAYGRYVCYGGDGHDAMAKLLGIPVWFGKQLSDAHLAGVSATQILFALKS